jgi:hypothetical protein
VKAKHTKRKRALGDLVGVGRLRQLEIGRRALNELRRRLLRLRARQGPQGD